MYEEMKITTPSGGCDCQKKQQSKTCKDTYNKIDLGCFGQNHFAVENYFSELVHDWEKEAARHNLGITELENIHYETEMDEDNNELLTYIVFQYRRGYELVTRKFRVAPKGEDGKDGTKGDTGPQGPQGPQGNTPILRNISVNWVDTAAEEKGTFKLDCDSEVIPIYDLELDLKRPAMSVTDLNSVIDIISANFVPRNMYNKLADKVEALENRIPNGITTGE